MFDRARLREKRRIPGVLSAFCCSVASFSRPNTNASPRADLLEVWIQASYNPILNARGQAVEVDQVRRIETTEQVLRIAPTSKGQIDAISRSQAVIEIQSRWHHHHGKRELPGRDGIRLDRRDRGPASPTCLSKQDFQRQRRALSSVLGGACPRRVPGRRVQAESQRAARKSGSRRPTIRSSIPAASPSRSSSMPPTSNLSSWRDRTLRNGLASWSMPISDRRCTAASDRWRE